MYRSKRGEKVGVAVVDTVQEYNMHILFRSVCKFWRSSTIRRYRGSTRALAGSSRHQHASLHLHAALCTSAVTLTPRLHRRSSNVCLFLETRLCKRASYDVHLLPDPQSTHAVDPDTFEYLPVQHRHASVHTHQPLRMLPCSISPQPFTLMQTLVGQ
jgi:hypothetical protein